MPCHGVNNHILPLMAGVEASTHTLPSLHVGRWPFTIDDEGEGPGVCAPRERVWPYLQVCGPIVGLLTPNTNLATWIGSLLFHLVSNCKSQIFKGPISQTQFSNTLNFSQKLFYNEKRKPRRFTYVSNLGSNKRSSNVFLSSTCLRRPIWASLCTKTCVELQTSTSSQLCPEWSSLKLTHFFFCTFQIGSILKCY